MYNGLTQQPWLKRSPEFCPRCGAKAVSRLLRCCAQCKGVLLFADVDDAAYAIERRDGWYMWDKPQAAGVMGWYPQSFYGITYGGKH